MSTKDLARLLEHRLWANTTVIECLKAQRMIPQKATAILGHLLAAEDVWLWRIKGNPQKALPLWPDLSLADCEARSAGNEEAFRELLGSMNDSGLRKDVSYVNSKGERFQNSIEDILIHVCMHGSYHRGQIAALVRAGGGNPVNTDYITWARSARRQEADR